MGRLESILDLPRQLQGLGLDFTPSTSTGFEKEK